MMVRRDLQLFGSFGCLLFSVFIAPNAVAEEKEPTAIVEIGAATDWDFPGSPGFGPTVGVEFTPIKDWLEIEAGTGPFFFNSGPAQWNADILFKKPFELSETAELMVGLGPELNYTIGGGTKWATEFAFDFMFWPWPDRKYGWFLEPAYSYGGVHYQSLGLSIGLLVAIR
jgi:hypothetical protein